MNCCFEHILNAAEWVLCCHNELRMEGKKCNVCSCWMHDFENKILHYQPDNDYPTHIDPESLANGMLVSYDKNRDEFELKSA